MRNVLVLLSWMVIGTSFGQVTLIVDSIPANTPPGDTLFVAGNFTGWNPGRLDFQLTEDTNGHFVITFTPSSYNLAYKFTRGSWATVEGNAAGGFRPDRTASAQPGDTLYHQILSWEGGGNTSTAAINVIIDSTDFPMPQLNRTRRVWVYLPPDYATSGKDYPVLYMHDGQNVFDAATAFSGEWEVDETLNALHANGDSGIIVVAVDNGGANRINEYSPWVNPQYGGGEGEQYIDFLVETLKPYIDSSYRTKPDRMHTGIMGSSLGGLISFYAGLAHPEVYGKVGVFSPSFWFSDSIDAFVQDYDKQYLTDMYFLAGGKEGNGSVVTNVKQMTDLLFQEGFLPDELYGRYPANGEHSEWFWREEFAAAYRWLFLGLTNDVNTLSGNPLQVKLYPNPADQSFTLDFDANGQPFEVIVYNLLGQEMLRQTMTASKAIDCQDWDTGVYFVKVKLEQQVSTVKLTVKR